MGFVNDGLRVAVRDFYTVTCRLLAGVNIVLHHNAAALSPNTRQRWQQRHDFASMVGLGSRRPCAYGEVLRRIGVERLFVNILNFPVVLWLLKNRVLITAALLTKQPFQSKTLWGGIGLGDRVGRFRQPERGFSGKATRRRPAPLFCLLFNDWQ